MKKLVIKGGNRLEGRIRISGSKNSSLPLMVASILTDGVLTLKNVPCLTDIGTMTNLLSSLGVECTMDTSYGSEEFCKTLKLNGGKLNNQLAHYDIVRKMRASVCVLGPLLAKCGKAKVSLPGGCAIGSRPVDLHITGLEALGAKIEIDNGYIIAETEHGNRLKGGVVKFKKVSVGATENILMAATLAEGKTIIKNAAKEPEVTELANCLIEMGANISGAGTSEITVEGVEKLHGITYEVVPDRIEAGTYVLAAAITDGDIVLEKVRRDLFLPIEKEIKACGIAMEWIDDENVRIYRTHEHLKPIHITTKPFPGFATDMQAQFTALLATVKGNSSVKETIFENRFMHVPELNRMGADISVDGNTAHIKGVDHLSGAEVMATDLRASVALVLAGLVAKGETTVNRIYHLERGYERLDKKLNACGAEIEVISDEESEEK